jgi:hypothetical protein
MKQIYSPYVRGSFIENPLLTKLIQFLHSKAFLRNLLGSIWPQCKLRNIMQGTETGQN